MRSEDALRETVPVTGGRGKATVPNAWRREGSGAPKGDQNAFKTGLHTEEMREWRRELSELTRAATKTPREIS